VAAGLLVASAAPLDAAKGILCAGAGEYLLQVEDFDGPWRERTDVAGYLGRGFCTAFPREGAPTVMKQAVRIDRAGTYFVWLRAYAGPDRDPWKGRRALQLAVNGRKLARTHDRTLAGWSWQLAGRVRLGAGPAEVVVHDADEGYEAADAVLLTDRDTGPSGISSLYDLFLHVRQVGAGNRLLVTCQDGTRLESDAITGWRRQNGAAGLDDAALLHALRGFRWLRNRSVTAPSPEGTAGGFVEFHNQDRLPGSVIGGAAALADPWSPAPQVLLVQSKISLVAGGTQLDRLGVLADEVRRVVFPGAKPLRRLHPGTLFCRDGRRIAFRALRWGAGEVRLLTQEDVQRLALEEVADVHLPQADVWERYYRELAALAPAGDGGIVRLQTSDGLIVTTSAGRCDVADGGRRQERIPWCCVVQPVWSPRALWVRAATIHARWHFAPHEVPLSRVPPHRAAQQSSLGRNWWAWRVDRSVSGGDLHSGGQPYGWGFGVHATNELAFRLPACVRAFRTRIGLDRVAGNGGCAVAKVFVNQATGGCVYRSKHLVGSDEVVDTGEIRLAGPDDGQDRLVLVADAAHEGRPKGADPFDIRDRLDWLEPLLLLDAGRLGREVARRVSDNVPAWRGWRVRADGGAPVRLVTRWDGSYPRGPRFALDVAPGTRALTLSTQRRITKREQWLYLRAQPRAEEAKPGSVEVRIGGRPIARLAAPPVGFDRPFLVPLRKWLGRKVALDVIARPSATGEHVRWEALALTPRKTAVDWSAMEIVRTAVLGSSKLAVQADGSILATGKQDDAETFIVECRTDLPRITAFRLEALADPTLPAGGPGRNSNGNFHLANLQVTAPIRRREPFRGRYVRIELPGGRRTLRLAEVQAFAPPRQGPSRNLAPGGKASQSSTEGKFAAAMAVNGKCEIKHGSADYSSTKIEEDPWWELDLGSEETMDRIVVWNRAYYYFKDELAHFSLIVLDGSRKVVLRRDDVPDPLPAVEISNPDPGRIAVESAAATAHQEWGDYSAARSLDTATRGWATGLAGQSHAAVYVLKRPIDARGTGLTFHLRHCRGGVWQTAGTLGRFRLLATEQPPPVPVEHVASEVPLLPDGAGEHNTQK